MSSATASKKYPGRGKLKNPVKNPGPVNRKLKKKLDIRVHDFAVMMGTKNPQSTHSRKETGGFHQPGSYSK